MSLTEALIYVATTPIPGENSARLHGVVSVRPLAVPCWFSQELALREPRTGAQEYQTENNVQTGGGEDALRRLTAAPGGGGDGGSLNSTC